MAKTGGVVRAGRALVKGFYPLRKEIARGLGPRRQEALDEDLHDAAADLVLAVDGLGEGHGDEAGGAGLQDLHGGLPALGLAAAATDGAAEGAVGPDGHAGAGLSRRGAAAGGHRGHGQRLPLLQAPLYLSKDLVHGESSS